MKSPNLALRLKLDHNVSTNRGKEAAGGEAKRLSIVFLGYSDLLFGRQKEKQQATASFLRLLLSCTCIISKYEK